MAWQKRSKTKDLSKSVAEGAREVNAAASQVSKSSQALAQGAVESAASLEETSASVEEIGSMARQNTENSQKVAGIVGQTQKEFDEAGHAMESMVVAINEIRGSSQRISRIIKEIDEIAFKTNILALNAAVEAERRRAGTGIRRGRGRGSSSCTAQRAGREGYCIAH